MLLSIALYGSNALFVSAWTLDLLHLEEWVFYPPDMRVQDANTEDHGTSEYCYSELRLDQR